jgi:hypothetical protein
VRKICVTALIAVIWCASAAFGQSGVKRYEAGPIVSSESIDEPGFNLGYGGRVGFNASRVIGVEGYFARHPLPSFESSPGTLVDERSSVRTGVDIKLTRRFLRYPLSVFALGGPAFLRSSALWTYAGYSQRVKGTDKALHAGGGVELQIRPQWLIRLDVTDFATHSSGSRDFPGSWHHHVDLTLGTMFRFW